MAQWNAKEKAWAKANNVTLGKKTTGGLANVAAYRKKAGLPPKGSAPKPPTGNITPNPVKPNTPGQLMSKAERDALLKKTANPHDDRGIGIDWRPKGDQYYGSEYRTGGKAPQTEADWKKYGNDAVNKDLKWQYNQGKTGYGSYTDYLKAHYNEYGKYENRLAKEQPKKSSGSRSAPAPTAAPAPPSPTADISQGERDFISPPASGLEDTILTEPAIDPATGMMETPVDYRDPRDNAPMSGYGEFEPPRSFLTLSEEKEKRQSFLTRAG